jgi:phage terminase large subunit-like protein
VTAHAGSDETGIIVAGCDAMGHAYILDDLSGTLAPAAWAQRAIDAYHTYQADRVIAEVNQGGDLVEQTLRALDPSIAYKAVRASRGKVARAEPVAALDSGGRVHHAGTFEKQEDQMCSFDPVQLSGSPDRMDARTWAITELLLGRRSASQPTVWRI